MTDKFISQERDRSDEHLSNKGGNSNKFIDEYLSSSNLTNNNFESRSKDTTLPSLTLFQELGSLANGKGGSDGTMLTPDRKTGKYGGELGQGPYDVRAMPSEKIDENATAIAEKIVADPNNFDSKSFKDMLDSASKGHELDQFVEAINKAFQKLGSEYSIDATEKSEGGEGTSFTGPRYYPEMYHHIKAQLSGKSGLLDTIRTSYGGQDPRIVF
ncbi:MAG: hypothetical protein K2X81_18860 [Candidatus Obscuribacterales bacterium]|nr:hypothetical protein [Candidatus Obscuribacterales bacterium]